MGEHMCYVTLLQSIHVVQEIDRFFLRNRVTFSFGTNKLIGRKEMHGKMKGNVAKLENQ